MKNINLVSWLSKFFIFSAFIAVVFCMGYYGYTSFKKSHLRSMYGFQTSFTEYNVKQLECLTRNVYFEAAAESFEGKVAVAQVTINRVNDPRFPKSICEVVYQKNIFYEKTVCQFSWYCSSPSTLKVVNNAAYKESEKVAKMVMFENFRLPSLEHSKYYHADYVNPGWKKTRVIKIGRHIFYE
jgi:spore germination cell wall hydrolase CwlJ-like protein